VAEHYGTETTLIRIRKKNYNSNIPITGPTQKKKCFSRVQNISKDSKRTANVGYIVETGSVADPEPGWVKNSDHISESLETIFLG
jgi:hypothetical protein